MSIDAFLSISGHLYPEEGYLLQALAADKRVLEIGTHHGRSTVAMAATAISVDTIDNYQGDSQIGAPNLAQTIQGIADSKLGHKIDILQVDFVKFLSDCDASQYDFIFYDGPHTPPVYEKHFLDWVIQSGFKGTIAIHDYKPAEHEMRYVVESVDDFEKATGLVRQGPLQGTSIAWFNPRYSRQGLTE